MNERIKLLATQANPDFAKFYIVGPWHAEDIEKFAELIVKECAETVLGFRNQFGDSAHAEIKEHFGVKE